MPCPLKPNGRLEIVPIGHWSARFAEGGRLTIFTDHGQARGTCLPLKTSGHAFGGEVDTQPSHWDQVEVRVDVRARTAGELEAFHRTLQQPGDEEGEAVGADKED